MKKIKCAGKFYAIIDVGDKPARLVSAYQVLRPSNCRFWYWHCIRWDDSKGENYYD